MAFTIGRIAVQAGYRVQIHDRIDSTNSEAMRLARAGERGPVWIVAREQTAGRGRQGRPWISFDGNLTASLLITEKIAPAEAATLGFVAGLALHGACTESAAGLSLRLKWPNDLLADGAKLAGLLLESEAMRDTLAVVIGFGVNIAAAPDNVGYPAVSLAALGRTVTAEHLFARLTDAWLRYHGLWGHGRGFAEIRWLWLECAQGLGDPVSIRVADRIEQGVFDSLDGQGRLILRAQDGRKRAISAGDVQFGGGIPAGAAH